MAFERKNNSMRDAVVASLAEVTSVVEKPVRSAYEKKKAYQFMLKPSLKERLVLIAQENGYRSASDYLEQLLEKELRQ